MKARLILILCLVSSVFGFSQEFTTLENTTAFKGYFTFHYQETTDKIFLEVSQLDTEFLYVNALSEGIGSNDIGIDRGQLGDGVVVKFIKRGNKLLLIQPNQMYRANSNNKEEKQSVKEAFAKSVLHGFVIKETQQNTYLVDATSFLMRDAHGVARTLARSNQGNYRLDLSRSAVNLDRTKAFPKNVEFDLMLTFQGEPKGYNIRSVTPDASAITVHQHHSFIELPDNNYKPRVYDPRSGSFSMQYLDYATPVNEPIVKRFIYRHRLEKKNPKAAVSEAVEPIIYYLDRGTPEPVKSALLTGGRWWNQAFEAIGYTNAFQIKMLPEGADPLDIRYNMVQWVHRSTRGWSYGASISDPRTGEILKGHVSLGSLRIRQDFLIAQALAAPYKNNSVDDSHAMNMAIARIRQLSAHEIGHTLGFAHNFAASTKGRISVMDYPHPKLSLKNGQIDFSEAYDDKIGAWDKVAVAYSYQDFEGDETTALRKLLDDAFASGMRFISDPDARPAGSAHAYAHLWDNGATVSDELANVLNIRKTAIQNFSTDNIKTGEPYSVLEDVFVPLYFFHRYQTEATAKIIGGLDYSYAVKGGRQQVLKVIEPAIQRAALEAVAKTIAVEEIAIPKTLLSLFPPRALGYSRTRESFKSKAGVAFDPFSAVEAASKMTFSFVLHPERATRLVHQKSLDADQLCLGDVIDYLIDQTFHQKHNDTYHEYLQHVVNAQLLDQLFYLHSSSTYPQVAALVSRKINELETKLTKADKKGKRSMIQDQYLSMISSFKKNPSNYTRTQTLTLPDGSPIGTQY